MRQEIDLDLGLSFSKEVLLGHHSLLNPLKVLKFELSAFHQFVLFYFELRFITLGERKLEENRNEIEEKFLSFADDLKNFSGHSEFFKNQADILLDIVQAAIVRVGGFKKDQIVWTAIPVAEIQSKLESFFNVIEKVSRQRFRIVYPAQAPGPNDFLIKFCPEGKKGLTTFLG